MIEGIPDDIETVESGSGSLATSSDGAISRDVEIKWLVHSLEGYKAAEAKGIKLAPLFYSGHRRSRLQCRGVGNGWYEIVAEYANAAVDAYEGFGIKSPNGDFNLVPQSVAVDTTGGTEHITQAWSDSEDPEAYVGKFAKEGIAPNTGGAVNVSGNTVNGVDITVPSFQFTETWYVPAKYLFVGTQAKPTPYLKTLYEMTGKVNLDAFRVFKAGEVLFLGVRFEASAGQTMVPVTYSFAARERRVDFHVGDIPITIKDGWDFMWIEYEDTTENDRLFRKPKYVYVDRVYERKKFETLELQSNWLSMYLQEGKEFAHPLAANQQGVR